MHKGRAFVLPMKTSSLLILLFIKIRHHKSSKRGQIREYFLVDSFHSESTISGTGYNQEFKDQSQLRKPTQNCMDEIIRCLHKSWFWLFSVLESFNCTSLPRHLRDMHKVDTDLSEIHRFGVRRAVYS